MALLKCTIAEYFEWSSGLFQQLQLNVMSVVHIVAKN